MKEKKYIDRLYQEKFRDFEATPRDDVWNSIAAKLKEDQKRKPVVAPLYSRLAGVAAILAFLLFIGEWILPVQRGAAVATEETEETNALPAPASPVNSSLTVIPSEAEPIAETEISASRTDLPKASTEQNISGIASAEINMSKIPTEQNRIAEISASEMSLKNIIFETPSLTVTGIENQKEKETPQPEKKSLLEEILKEEEVEVAIIKPTNNFEISTHAAPIYYGNMGEGNFLDSRLNNNSSKGEITYSYGINIAYNLSNKVKIRSGVNKVNMSYNTSGVAYQAIAGSAPMKSVSLEKGATMTHPTGGVNSGRKPTGGTLRNPAGFLTPGNLNQKMGFLEVPLEVEYNLFSSKFELNLIGGASTLFLEENQVSLNAETISAEGRANNLNSVSFSTNIGLGLDYNLTDKFKLNLEPMLKYQLNTFETSSSDVQPYYFGIYSGVSYKF